MTHAKLAVNEQNIRREKIVNYEIIKLSLDRINSHYSVSQTCGKSQRTCLFMLANAISYNV